MRPLPTLINHSSHHLLVTIVGEKDISHAIAQRNFVKAEFNQCGTEGVDRDADWALIGRLDVKDLRKDFLVECGPSLIDWGLELLMTCW